MDLRDKRYIAFFLVLALIEFVPRTRADEPAVVEITSGLAIPLSGRQGRSLIAVDPIAAKIADGSFATPKKGDAVGSQNDDRIWQELRAGDDRTFRDRSLNGGYLYVSIPSVADRVMTLEAAGHAMVYANGVPRAGDVYSHGYVHVPILLRKGENSLLFRGARGSIRAQLIAPRAPIAFDLSDTTLPDLNVGQEIDAWAGIVVVNATNEMKTGLLVTATLDGRTTETPLPPLVPLSARKVPVLFKRSAPTAEGISEVRLDISAVDRPAAILDTARIKLTVKPPGATTNRTFLSNIDGSVQYYGFVPAKSEADAKGKPGLILTLHGAGVEGGGQARVYRAKPGLHIVAPTNRRPYGFDWEDWGRLDAIEVLELVQSSLDTDPRRTYITGHSMGGHGTWHIGVTYPDRFAAIAPSAGWVSMFSYAGARKIAQPSPMEEILQRAASPSDTLALATNLAGVGVYILHGDADDNVPVAQARTMREALAKFHPDFTYYERPGAGHWWGNECCDWPPLIEFLSRHEIPANSPRVDFTTASPAISSRCHWVVIEAQHTMMTPSRVELRRDPEKRRVSGKTTNVARLSFDLSGLSSGDLTIELDGQTLKDIKHPEGAARIWLARGKDAWSIVSQPSPDEKSPNRSGPFKNAFRNRMIFVYGTKGKVDENRWSFARARYDAETFAYRGNGSIDIVPDTAFDSSRETDRNVILFGNAETNAAWDSLLGKSPVQVGHDSVKVGPRAIEGNDLACFFVRPRPGSTVASVGVISGSGLVGMKVADQIPYFVSGVELPDLLVIGKDGLEKGISGIRAAGFFGLDWGVESGEIIWKE